MLPTPQNPLIIYNAQRSIAMKNDVRILLESGGGIRGVGRSKATMIVLDRGRQVALSARQVQGFDSIPLPKLVGVYVQIGFFGRKHIVNSDLDNAYTSVQETWAGAVIDNDKQIADSHQSRFIVPDKSLEHSITFMWVIPEEHYSKPSVCFLEFAKSPLFSMKTTELIKEIEKVKNG